MLSKAERPPRDGITGSVVDCLGKLAQVDRGSRRVVMLRLSCAVAVIVIVSLLASDREQPRVFYAPAPAILASPPASAAY